MKLDNLAVVFIGTDKYLDFLPSWYESCEEHLLPDVGGAWIHRVPSVPGFADHGHEEPPLIALQHIRI